MFHALLQLSTASICRWKIITGQLRSRLARRFARNQSVPSSNLCARVKWQLFGMQDDMYLYWIVRNKDTCPGCDARRGVYTRRRCNRGAYSWAQRERERKKEKERERESGLEEAGNYFHKFRAALCGPLAWRARSLARAGARSVVDEFSLYGLASLPLQKNVSIQGARLIQTPVFIAAGSGGSFVFARPTRPVHDERARSLSCSFSCCVYHVWPRKHNTCTHTHTHTIFTDDLEKGKICQTGDE